MIAATNVKELQRDIYAKYEDLSQRLSKRKVAKYVVEKPESIAFDFGVRNST
ncbi:hypothetical protein P4S64_06985 [Vibrio sp. M60_M31a]